LQDQILSLEQFSACGSVTPEDSRYRQILFGSKLHVYRIIYRIDLKEKIVRTLQVRHGARPIPDKETK